jgi:hypothetical protein
VRLVAHRVGCVLHLGKSTLDLLLAAGICG